MGAVSTSQGAVKGKRKKAKWDSGRLDSLRAGVRNTMLDLARMSAELEQLASMHGADGHLKLKEKDLRHLERLHQIVEKVGDVKDKREQDQERAVIAQDAITLGEIFREYRDGGCSNLDVIELCDDFVETGKRRSGLWRSRRNGKLKKLFDQTRKHNKHRPSPVDVVSVRQIGELGGPVKAASFMLGEALGQSPEAVESIRKAAKKNLAITRFPAASIRETLFHFIQAVTGVSDIACEDITRVLYGNNAKLEVTQHQSRDWREHPSLDAESIRQAIRDEVRRIREHYRKLDDESS